MPLGVAAASVKNLPTEPYVIDDALWQQTAKKNVLQVNVPSGGGRFQLPQTGIVGKLQIKFDGQLVVATAATAVTDRYPYGLLDTFSMNVNNGLTTFGVIGEDLHVRQDAAFPAYNESIDVYPGSQTNTAPPGPQFNQPYLPEPSAFSIATGTYDISLQWEVPVATELVTLTGGLYAQTPSTAIVGIIGQAALSELFGTPANCTLTGSWSVTETMFVPAYDSQGRIVVPSGIASMHGMTSVDLGLTQTGQVPFELVRGAGQMQRLFLALRSTPTQRLSAAPNAAADVSLTSVALSYGGNQVPYNWAPAADLLRQNNEDYGWALPYDYLCLDFVKQDPIRDAVIYAGLTELKALVGVSSSVSPSGGTAHLVQEDLW